MNDRDLAQVEQPPLKLKKRNAKMKKLSYCHFLPTDKEKNMKKMILWLCVLLLVPSLATAGGDGFSVSALRKQVDATAGDEFRSNLYIPQADALPILKVRLKDIEQTGQGELSGYPSVVQMDYEKYFHGL